MSIRVTCPGCHTRFNVSDKFAGREGPCPKCKKVIKIPDKTEEVVIHAPESGPKDSEGRPVLKPISRDETNLSSVQIALIACTIIGFLMGALILRMVYTDAEAFPSWLIWVGAIGLAVPVVFGGYTFLRDQELGSFLGKELWMRVVGCALIYALLWLLVPLMNYAFVDLGQTGAFVAIGIILAVGSGVSVLCFDFDYLVGMLHCGMYLACCLLCRFLAGIGTVPGGLDTDPGPATDEPVVTVLFQAISGLAQGVAM